MGHRPANLPAPPPSFYRRPTGKDWEQAEYDARHYGTWPVLVQQLHDQAAIASSPPPPPYRPTR